MLLPFIPAAGWAQIVAPPPFDAASPEGVNYRNGSFSYSEIDLAIGGDGPSGLSLVRHYSSAISVPSDMYYASPGWTHNLQGYISNAPDPQDPDEPPSIYGPEATPYTYTVAIANRSATFHGGSVYVVHVSSTGGPVGTYTPLSTPNTSLVFNGTNAGGYYTFIDTDGTVVNFNQGASGFVSNMTMPDGTRWDWSYTSGLTIKSVISNRGWAMLVNGTTACVVNMAQTYITATSTCPTDAQSITYGYTAGTYSSSVSLLTSATKNGATTNYGYVGADHLGCIKRPGQTFCAIQNTYAVCPNDPARYSIQPDTRAKDPVTTQVDAAGRTIHYLFADNYTGYPDSSANLCRNYTTNPTTADIWPFRESRTKITVNSEPSSYVMTEPTSGHPTSTTDELGRITGLDFGALGQLNGVRQPEGNGIYYVRDLQNNTFGNWLTAKPGSGLSDQQTVLHYPSSCANVKVCGKPDYVTDPRGNVTSYTYDSGHGGVLTETGPADAAGIHPVKRYGYVQRYAWIKNSGGTFSQASSPVWLLSTMKSCRASATVSGACAVGSSDEVVTTYEYGPDTGAVGNNLLVRGVAVTADGTTLRTCYGYDRDGNKIFETKPAAGLSVCS